MKNLLLRACCVALATLTPTLASAQVRLPVVKNTTGAPVSSGASLIVDSTGAEKGTATNPLVMGGTTLTATSTAATGSVTSSAVTSTGGTTPAFSAGTATIPFTPKVGYGVRLLLTGAATFTASVGTSTDACATVNTLTAGGSPISYTGSVNEFIDAPATTGVVVYCLVIAVTSGTESYGVRN